MSYTNQTANYGLPQYVADDKPTYLGDFNKAMLDIDTAIKANETIANSANTNATNASNSASEALSTATTAQTTATNADTKATNAYTMAETANTTASSADTKADTAISTANSASSEAQTATTTANTANATASSADTKADTAISTANSADTKADTALNRFNYSETEKVVGTWVDGRPVYEKTIVSNTAISFSSTANIPSGVTDLDLIVSYEGYGHHNTGNCFNLDKAHPSSFNYQCSIYYNNSGNFEIETASTVSFDFAIITFRYTKSTDPVPNN